MNPSGPNRTEIVFYDPVKEEYETVGYCVGSEAGAAESAAKKIARTHNNRLKERDLEEVENA